MNSSPTKFTRRTKALTQMAGNVSLLGLGFSTCAMASWVSIPSDGTSSAIPDWKGMNLTTELTLNGRPVRLTHDARTTLLDALRDQLDLTGTKKGCDQGQCGACTVLVDGQRVLGCLSLLASLEGKNVVTIEGLAKPDGTLHPMQQAFIDHDAFQCGYCTPGQIMSAIGCVEEGHAGNPDDIREYMSGNLCRCAAYPNIVTAITQAATQMKTAE